MAIARSKLIQSIKQTCEKTLSMMFPTGHFQLPARSTKTKATKLEISLDRSALEDERKKLRILSYVEKAKALKPNQLLMTPHRRKSVISEYATQIGITVFFLPMLIHYTATFKISEEPVNPPAILEETVIPAEALEVAVLVKQLKAETAGRGDESRLPATVSKLQPAPRARAAKSVKNFSAVKTHQRVSRKIASLKPAKALKVATNLRSGTNRKTSLKSPYRALQRREVSF